MAGRANGRGAGRDTTEALAQGVLSGERRAIARALTLVESDDPAGPAALRMLHPRLGRAHVVGVTGSPGTGKSTLVDRLIQHYRDEGLTVGVIAVDPSSPFTGGAILGDRIRMQSRSGDPEVFIRSMGARGHLGGLAAATADAVKVLDAAGKDVVLVETVGVGQGEVDIVRLADTVVVVLVPNLGDDVQAVKAGVMEIADVFVVNKADLAGADKVVGEVEAMLGLAHPEGEEPWVPPLVETVAERGDGVAELVSFITKHKEWSRRSGEWERRRTRRLHAQVRDLVQERVASFCFDAAGLPRQRFADLFGRIEAGEMDPHTAADAILDAFRSGPQT